MDKELLYVLPHITVEKATDELVEERMVLIQVHQPDTTIKILIAFDDYLYFEEKIQHWLKLWSADNENWGRNFYEEFAEDEEVQLMMWNKKHRER